jgi:hypothetical protein
VTQADLAELERMLAESFGHAEEISLIKSTCILTTDATHGRGNDIASHDYPKTARSGKAMALLLEY